MSDGGFLARRGVLELVMSIEALYVVLAGGGCLSTQSTPLDPPLVHNTHILCMLLCYIFHPVWISCQSLYFCMHIQVSCNSYSVQSSLLSRFVLSICMYALVHFYLPQ